MLFRIIYRAHYLITKKRAPEQQSFMPPVADGKAYRWMTMFFQSPSSSLKKLLRHFTNVLGLTKPAPPSSSSDNVVSTPERTVSYPSHRHALLGLTTREEVEAYDRNLYDVFEKQQQALEREEMKKAKEKNSSIDYDLVFMSEQRHQPLYKSSTSSAGRPFYFMQQQQQPQQQQPQQPPLERFTSDSIYSPRASRMMQSPSGNLPAGSYPYPLQSPGYFATATAPPQVLTFGASSNVSGSGGAGSAVNAPVYRLAPSTNISEEYLNATQAVQTRAQQSTYHNALLLSEEASHSLHLLGLTTFMVNNWSENMRRWLVQKMLTPLVNEMDRTNAQIAKFQNGDYKAYDTYCPLDITPQYQHLIPNFVATPEESLKFTLRYVVSSMINYINKNFKNNEFEAVLRKRLFLERYLNVPSAAVDRVGNRKHIIERLRAMSKGYFDRLGGLTSTTSEHGVSSSSANQYPTDDEILIHIWCKFIDYTLPADPIHDRCVFTNNHFIDKTQEKSSTLNFKTRNITPAIAGAVKKRKGLEKTAPVRKGLFICLTSRDPIHFNVEHDGTTIECQPGRNNLLDALVIFLHLINVKYDGYIDTISIHDSSLDLGGVVELE